MSIHDLEADRRTREARLASRRAQYAARLQVLWREVRQQMVEARVVEATFQAEIAGSNAPKRYVDVHLVRDDSEVRMVTPSPANTVSGLSLQIRLLEAVLDGEVREWETIKAPPAPAPLAAVPGFWRRVLAALRRLWPF